MAINWVKPYLDSSGKSGRNITTGVTSEVKFKIQMDGYYYWNGSKWVMTGITWPDAIRTYTFNGQNYYFLIYQTSYTKQPKIEMYNDEGYLIWSVKSAFLVYSAEPLPPTSDEGFVYNRIGSGYPIASTGTYNFIDDEGFHVLNIIGTLHNVSESYGRTRVWNTVEGVWGEWNATAISENTYSPEDLFVHYCVDFEGNVTKSYFYSNFYKYYISYSRVYSSYEQATGILKSRTEYQELKKWTYCNEEGAYYPKSVITGSGSGLLSNPDSSYNQLGCLRTTYGTYTPGSYTETSLYIDGSLKSTNVHTMYDDHISVAGVTATFTSNYCKAYGVMIPSLYNTTQDAPVILPYFKSSAYGSDTGGVSTAFIPSLTGFNDGHNIIIHTPRYYSGSQGLIFETITCYNSETLELKWHYEFPDGSYVIDRIASTVDESTGIRILYVLYHTATGTTYYLKKFDTNTGVSGYEETLTDSSSRLVVHESDTNGDTFYYKKGGTWRSEGEYTWSKTEDIHSCDKNYVYTENGVSKLDGTTHMTYNEGTEWTELSFFAGYTFAKGNLGKGTCISWGYTGYAFEDGLWKGYGEIRTYKGASHDEDSPFYVEETTPADDATGVSPTAPIFVTFNLKPKESTLLSTYLKVLLGDNTGTEMEWFLCYVDDVDIKLKTLQSFPYSSLITVTLDANIKSDADNYDLEPYEFSFTTAGPTPSPDIPDDWPGIPNTAAGLTLFGEPGKGVLHYMKIYPGQYQEFDVEKFNAR